MTIYTCKHCKKSCSTKSNLNYHIKNTKYCLNIQGNINDIKCEYCDNSFGSKRIQKNHLSKCTEFLLHKNSVKYDEQIKFLQLELIKKEVTIKELQDKLENIAIKSVSRATTTNKTQINNYIQQLQPVTDDHFNDSAQYLTIEHILKGAEGYANFALQNSLQDRMLCVDYSRRKVKFKDKDGHIIVDPEMTELATKLFKSIKEKNNELILECIERLKDNFGEEIGRAHV